MKYANGKQDPSVRSTKSKLVRTVSELHGPLPSLLHFLTFDSSSYREEDTVAARLLANIKILHTNNNVLHCHLQDMYIRTIYINKISFCIHP